MGGPCTSAELKLGRYDCRWSRSAELKLGRYDL